MKIPLLNSWRHTSVPKRGLVAEYNMTNQRNLLKQSENFNKSEWVKSASVIINQNSIISPDSSFTGNLIIMNAVDDLIRQTIHVIPNKVYIFSFWVKRGTSTELKYRAYDATNSADIVPTTSYYSQTTDNWVRISFSITIPANCVSLNVYPVTTTGTTGTVYLWGAQLELGETLTDYQKTTDLQTIWNNKKESLLVTNLVRNGNFTSSSDGLADFWDINDVANKSVINNTQIFTADSQYDSLYPRDSLTGFNEGDKLFAFCNLKADSTSVVFKLMTNGFDLNRNTIFSSGTNQLERISMLTTVQPGDLSIEVVISDYRLSNWTEIQVQEVYLINLTDIFGVGNEPTKEQCDYLFNVWHDGTKMIDLPLYNGTLGSTTGPDTNDPIWAGNALSFTTDDYVKLPYMINAEQDFTVYLVTNVGVNAPSAIEEIWSAGSSSSDIPNIAVYRHSTGFIGCSIRNNSGSNVEILIPPLDVINGIRLLSVKRIGDKFLIKDVLSGRYSINSIPPNPITLNQMSLGCLLRTTPINFSNQPEYLVSFHGIATTDAEDQQTLRYVRRELAKRGITL